MSREMFLETKQIVEALMKVVTSMECGLSVSDACDISGVNLNGFSKFVIDYKSYSLIEQKV